MGNAAVQWITNPAFLGFSLQQYIFRLRLTIYFQTQTNSEWFIVLNLKISGFVCLKYLWCQIIEKYFDIFWKALQVIYRFNHEPLMPKILTIEVWNRLELISRFNLDPFCASDFGKPLEIKWNWGLFFPNISETQGASKKERSKLEIWPNRLDWPRYIDDIDL